MVQIKRLQFVFFFLASFAVFAATDPYPGVRQFNATLQALPSAITVGGTLHIENGFTSANVHRFTVVPRTVADIRARRFRTRPAQIQDVLLVNGKRLDVLIRGGVVTPRTTGIVSTSTVSTRAQTTDSVGRAVALQSDVGVFYLKDPHAFSTAASSDNAADAISLAYNPPQENQSIYIEGAEIGVDYDVRLTADQRWEYFYPNVVERTVKCAHLKETKHIDIPHVFNGTCDTYTRQFVKVERRTRYYETNYVGELFTQNAALRAMQANQNASFAYFFTDKVKTKVVKDTAKGSDGCQPKGDPISVVCNGIVRKDLIRFLRNL
jgi:hypothetical protein